VNRSLKSIFRKHYSSLCNYAYTKIRDAHAAEDIVQTVFVQLWENEKFLDLETPESYLLACVRNKCFDHLKRPQRRNEVLMEELPEVSIQEDTKTLKEEDVIPLLHFFAGQLPAGMQKVFLLNRQEGLSYREIADELEVSVKTVENQMGMALKKLRIMLKKHKYLPLILFFLQ